MSRYQHTKGKIKDNAVEALLHDPLFRQRVEKNHKGKGSYQRKMKHVRKGNWEASSKITARCFTTGLLVLIRKVTGGYSVLSTGRESHSVALLP